MFFDVYWSEIEDITFMQFENTAFKEFANPRIVEFDGMESYGCNCCLYHYD